MTDELTGLPAYDALALAVKEPAAAVFFDVDALRRVTNEQGHLASDDVLKRSPHGSPRRATWSAWAGDKFVLLLPGRAIENATGSRTTSRRRAPRSPA